ncbi:MAG: carboxymuconolactone decarboxylase family protein [Methylocystis sp.]
MVQLQDWPELTKALSANLRELRLGAPEAMKAFGALATTASAGNALDAKIKELMALAIPVSARCDDCIAFHIKAALDRGAARDEIMETLGVAIYMGGGPSVMYASHALAACSQFSAAAKPSG